MSETVITLLCAVSLLLCNVLAYLVGHYKGRAFGWQEGYFGKAHDSRNSRDNFGRFKAKNAPTHTWRATR